MRRFKEWAKKIKKNLNILYLAYKHEKTPWYAKVLIFIVVAYALSPVDLIPDFIPLLGYLDDLLLLPLGITVSMKLIPDEVMKECREEFESREIDQSFKKRGVYAAIVIVGLWVVLILLLLKKLGIVV